MHGGQVIARLTNVAASRRAMLAFVSAAILGVFLLAAASSRADDVAPATRFAVGSPAMQIAQQVALATWGVDACGGQVALEWGSDDPNINARSYWANPVSSYDAPAQNTQCRIVFNAGMSYTWVKFCTVLVHEYGHLSGHPHSADGPDVMSPIYRAPLPACTTTADPTAAPAPPAPTPPAATTSTSTPTANAAAAPARLTAVTKRAKRRSGAQAARAKTRSKPHAFIASAPAPLYSDADSEPLPWEAFAAE